MKLGGDPCLINVRVLSSRSNAEEKILTKGHQLKVCPGTGWDQDFTHLSADSRICAVPYLGSCGYRRFLFTDHRHLGVRPLHRADTEIPVQLRRAPINRLQLVAHLWAPQHLSTSGSFIHTRYGCPGVLLWNYRSFAGLGNVEEVPSYL